MSNLIADDADSMGRAGHCGSRSAVHARLLEILAGMFPSSPPSELADIAAHMDLVRLRRDEFLFRQGDPGDSLYILITGRVQVIGCTDCPGCPGGATHSRGPDCPAGKVRVGTRLLNELTSGESIGEMALITGEPRAAHVIAIRDSQLARLSREAFQPLISRHPEFLLAIARTLIRWLRQSDMGATNRRAPTRRTIAVVACQPVTTARANVDLAGFTNRLSAALAECGLTIHVTRDGLARLPGLAPVDGPPKPIHGEWGPDSPWTGLLAWLDQQASANQFVLLEGQGDSAWTQFCIRQADVVLAVAPWQTHRDGPAAGRSGVLPVDSHDQHGPATGSNFIRNRGRAACWLVLLHSDGDTKPSDTRGQMRMLARAQAESLVNAQAEFDAHAHVRMGRDADFQRLARLVTGRAVGLALGGGGARGLAHIGVLAALEEAGIPIDRIGGTSMGAIIGAMHCLGLSRADMIEMNKKVWLGARPFGHYTWPFVSLFGAGTFDQIARMVCGRSQIEDLWLDYFCVSTNLTTSELMVHHQGELWKAVRASASLPGAVPPVLHNGQLLADGGLLNNLPGDILWQLGCQRVITVDVSADVRLATSCREMPSAWRLMRSRLGLADRPDIPGIFDILYGSMVAASKGQAQAVCGAADISLQPPVKGFRTLQFDAIDEIVRIGYEYTRERIGQIRDALELGQAAPGKTLR